LGRGGLYYRQSLPGGVESRLLGWPIILLVAGIAFLLYYFFGLN
jgi:hypothetical protein